MRSASQRTQLHRAVSKLGWGSRTEAWDWIRAGRVRVDGVVVRDPLTWVALGSQRITRDDETAPARAPITLALHKPRGIVTTRRDERGRRTVYDLLPADMPWIFPAGRLDADSEGLLILTSDAQLALRLTDPNQHVPKTYRVTVAGIPVAAALQQLRQGIELDGKPTRPAEVRVHERGQDETVLDIVLTEGRNRQVRRMLSACGHRVRRLVRVAIGGFKLGKLAPGECRELTEEEVARLTKSGGERPA